jgi:hypothetical protein
LQRLLYSRPVIGLGFVFPIRSSAMRLIELARRPPSWLRIAFAGLALAFLLTSTAHITHRHDAIPGSATHVVACGYCLNFGGLADAGVHPVPVVAIPPSAERILAPPSLITTFERPSAAQPRAPPVS